MLTYFDIALPTCIFVYIDNPKYKHFKKFTMSNLIPTCLVNYNEAVSTLKAVRAEYTTYSDRLADAERRITDARRDKADKAISAAEADKIIKAAEARIKVIEAEHTAAPKEVEALAAVEAAAAAVLPNQVVEYYKAEAEAARRIEAAATTLCAPALLKVIGTHSAYKAIAAEGVTYKTNMAEAAVAKAKADGIYVEAVSIDCGGKKPRVFHKVKFNLFGATCGQMATFMSECEAYNKAVREGGRRHTDNKAEKLKALKVEAMAAFMSGNMDKALEIRAQIDALK